jgi:hypothetical protein
MPGFFFSDIMADPPGSELLSCRAKESYQRGEDESREFLEKFLLRKITIKTRSG